MCANRYILKLVKQTKTNITTPSRIFHFRLGYPASVQYITPLFRISHLVPGYLKPLQDIQLLFRISHICPRYPFSFQDFPISFCSCVYFGMFFFSFFLCLYLLQNANLTETCLVCMPGALWPATAGEFVGVTLAEEVC